MQAQPVALAQEVVGLAAHDFPLGLPGLLLELGLLLLDPAQPGNDSHAKLRSQVVPQVEEEEESLTGGAVCWEEERQGQTVRRRWVPWSKLLLKVFGVDAFQCPQCDGQMQHIAYTS